MSIYYSKQHRALQAQFGTEKMAERIEQLASHNEFNDDAKGFIEHSEMFFLTTINDKGQPTVSYKGGEIGFVKVLDANTLIFPSYDGNGMFLSMGNIVGNANIGMLFISFQTPHRIRVQGTATISQDAKLLAHYKEADFVVTVKLAELWQNCPRYIPKYEKVRDSRYVPRADCETPLAEWKRVDLLQDVLPPADLAKAQAKGTIEIGEWITKIQTGADDA
jgi:predicted pyridoxine 5'-phosphate oxidase superfamily flavin-nucleotide-binding protein